MNYCSGTAVIRCSRLGGNFPRLSSNLHHLPNLTSVMVANKNQHSVPVSYLEAWTDPNKPELHKLFVHLFDRLGGNHKRRSPANILSMPDLYTIFSEGGPVAEVVGIGLA